MYTSFSVATVATRMRKGLQHWRHLPTGASAQAIFDVLGRRWAMRIVWELRGGALNFRALRAACGEISPSVLQTRLHELNELTVIEKVPRLGYRLSVGGEQLYQVLETLVDWAEHNEVASDSNS